MKILVTGAHGLLGRSLLGQHIDVELIGCGRSTVPVEERPYHQVDLVDRSAVERLLAAVRPDWVIHTAALTDVDRCEVERPLARQINLDVVEHLADACQQVDAGLVQMSTDYVFDGQSGPYAETDPTRPLSYYGKLKLEGENAVLRAGVKGLVVRTLWLYGYIPQTRRNLVTWPLESLARGKAFRAVGDQWGNPTYVHDVARALVELCLGNARGIFHMGGSSYMTRYDLVVEVAQFFGLDTQLVERLSTAQAEQVAPRPLRSGLRSDALQTQIGRAPMSLREGLEHMARQESFCRDFAYLR